MALSPAVLRCQKGFQRYMPETVNAYNLAFYCAVVLVVASAWVERVIIFSTKRAHFNAERLRLGSFFSTCLSGSGSTCLRVFKKWRWQQITEVTRCRLNGRSCPRSTSSLKASERQSPFPLSDASVEDRVGFVKQRLSAPALALRLMWVSQGGVSGHIRRSALEVALPNFRALGNVRHIPPPPPPAGLELWPSDAVDSQGSQLDPASTWPCWFTNIASCACAAP